MSDVEATSGAREYAQLLSLAVHEMRTPVSVVGGYLRMLLRDTSNPLGERQRHMIEEAEKSCTRMVALIAELSDLSKIDAGVAPFKGEAVDLFAALAEVAAGVHESDDRGVQLQVVGPSSGAFVTGDPTRIRAALAAFLRAILREQPSACTVVAERRLASDGTPPSAIVVIAREESVQKAYSSEPARFDEKRGGLGLALPIARRVIEKCGGRVWSPASDGQPGEAESRGAMIISVPLVEPNR